MKRGDPAALAVLGYGVTDAVHVGRATFDPDRPRIGSSVRITLVVRNDGDRRAALNVDLRIHFVKANGGTSPKVFKVREVELEAGGRAALSKVVSLRQHTTRIHHPGEHRIEVVVNGSSHAAGSFALAPAGGQAQ